MKFTFRKLLFKFFSLFVSAYRMITFKPKNAINYHKAFFSFLSIFKKSFYYHLDGKKIYYNPHNSGLGWKIYFEGGFETNELKACDQFINKNSIVLDVGANIGVHSIYYSSLASEGLVYAFEPSRFTYEILLKNIRKISNIIPLGLGLFNKSDITEFYECENDALSGLKDTLRSPVKTKSRIICLRGDDFFKILTVSKIDFIKIDVEGLEQEVIEGLEQSIKKFKPVLFIEIYQGKNSNLHPDQTIGYIEGLGYDVFTLTQNGSLKKYQKHTDAEYSYFFIPKK